jgi:hypothetical protein
MEILEIAQLSKVIHLAMTFSPRFAANGKRQLTWLAMFVPSNFVPGLY